MDGSDDYFFDDDIVLDDQTLAVLDSEEQKYLSQAPPPPKRQKTDKGWKPVATVHGRPPVDDNDLPEISVHGDGSYAFRAPPTYNTAATLVPPQRVASVPAAPRVPAHARPPEPPARRPAPVPQSTAHTRVQDPPRREPPRVVASDQGEELRKQIEELRRENEKYRSQLKDATDAKLAKQGEVSILRQTIEKGAQDHATQVAKLKVAKEESEARQIALQKEMKAEMERLKTQFIFKQHELESSSRKAPMSVRSKRVVKDIPSTPLAVPSQMRGWNATDSHTEFPDQSPVRARAAPQGANTGRTPDKLKKPPKLLGFQNSFADATPVRSVPPRVKRDASMSEIVIPHHETFSPNPFSQQPNTVQTTDVQMTDFADEFTGSEAVDVEHPADEVEFMDDLQEIVPFNWKAELTRIIMTHSSLESTSPTLKLLVGVTLPAPEFAEKYSDAVTRVFELVASTSQHKDYELALPDLCRHLTSMLAMLNGTELVHELAALLNLLTCLSCSLPNFAPSLLAISQGNGDDYGIIETLCSIVRDHLEPTKQQTVLGGETVGLLEGLCWNLKEDLTSRLAAFCKSKDILMILLDTSQPSPLLRRTTQLIALLATHPQLSHDLLSSSDQRPPPSDGTKAKDTAKVPHIERLCSLLIDTSRTDPDAVEMKSQILTFFGILSVAHPDVHALLVGCQGLVPSLVVFLTQMASILWEGDEVFTMSAEAIDRIIRTLNQTLFLVHHLVFGIEPNFNLRHRLHYAPSRAFSGITHMFIVTFGRLAYADAPEWIESAQKLELESMSEMAQSLLNFVVDGPEGDGIWTAYQVDSGDASDTDEEDMEAKLLGT